VSLLHVEDVTLRLMPQVQDEALRPHAEGASTMILLPEE
jgi:hypothetical protein